MTTDADKAVNAAILQRYVEEKRKTLPRGRGYIVPWRTLDWTALHLVDCPSVRVEHVTAAWECWCMSDYTTDDEFVLKCAVTCDHGESQEFAYGRFGDIPTLLTQAFAVEWNNGNPTNCDYGEE